MKNEHKEANSVFWLANQILNLSWKFLGIAVVIALLRNGKDTIIMWIKTKNAEIQMRLFEKYKELKKEQKEKES